MMVASMTVVDGGNSGLCQWRQQGARVTWARAEVGVRARARATRATRVARAARAREGKRARARAATVATAVVQQ